MDQPLYHYKAVIKSVYDGDTCKADIDLGLHVWITGETLRLYGINAPEVRGEERPQGIVSRDYLRALILDREILVETIRDSKGKYGRYLARLWLDDDEEGLVDVNQRMVDSGHAVEQDY